MTATPRLHPVAPPDVPLAYRTAGTGQKDVLLVHGWVSSSRMWAGLMHTLAPHFRCWAPDLPGHGDSPLPPGQIPTLADFRGAVRNFCRSLAIRPYAIIGHSLGALITLAMALEMPEATEMRLGLLSPPVTGRLGMRIDALLRTRTGAALFRRSRRLWPLLMPAGLPTVFAPTPTHLWDKLRAEQRKLQDARRAQWGAVVGGALAAARNDLSPHLPRIQQPALVIVGTLDLTIPRSEAELAASRLPNARLVRLPGVGHQVTDEAPEIVYPLLLDFLLKPEESPDASA
ncbi:MAG: hypothetical protein Kow0077_32520 [Anaerolineae bacterium]